MEVLAIILASPLQVRNSWITKSALFNKWILNPMISNSSLWKKIIKDPRVQERNQALWKVWDIKMSSHKMATITKFFYTQDHKTLNLAKSIWMRVWCLTDLLKKLNVKTRGISLLLVCPSKMFKLLEMRFNLRHKKKTQTLLHNVKTSLLKRRNSLATVHSSLTSRRTMWARGTTMYLKLSSTKPKKSRHQQNRRSPQISL